MIKRLQSRSATFSVVLRILAADGMLALSALLVVAAPVVRAAGVEDGAAHLFFSREVLPVLAGLLLLALLIPWLLRLLVRSGNDPLACQFVSAEGRRLAVVFNVVLIGLVVMLAWGHWPPSKIRLRTTCASHC